MSTKSDIITALIEPAIAAARWLWHKAHGEDTAPDEAELKRIALASLTAQIARAELELQRLAAVADVAIASAALGSAAIDMRDAIRAIESQPGESFGTLLDGATFEHVWRAPDEDEAREESGICRNCGVYASEASTPCTGPRT